MDASGSEDVNESQNNNTKIPHENVSSCANKVKDTLYDSVSFATKYSLSEMSSKIPIKVQPTSKISSHDSKVSTVTHAISNKKANSQIPRYVSSKTSTIMKGSTIENCIYCEPSLFTPKRNISTSKETPHHHRFGFENRNRQGHYAHKSKICDKSSSSIRNDLALESLVTSVSFTENENEKKLLVSDIISKFEKASNFNKGFKYDSIIEAPQLDDNTTLGSISLSDDDRASKLKLDYHEASSSSGPNFSTEPPDYQNNLNSHRGCVKLMDFSKEIEDIPGVLECPLVNPCTPFDTIESAIVNYSQLDDAKGDCILVRSEHQKSEAMMTIEPKTDFQPQLLMPASPYVGRVVSCHLSKNDRRDKSANGDDNSSSSDSTASTSSNFSRNEEESDGEINLRNDWPDTVFDFIINELPLDTQCTHNESLSTILEENSCEIDEQTFSSDSLDDIIDKDRKCHRNAVDLKSGNRLCANRDDSSSHSNSLTTTPSSSSSSINLETYTITNANQNPMYTGLGAMPHCVSIQQTETANTSKAKESNGSGMFVSSEDTYAFREHSFYNTYRGQRTMPRIVVQSYDYDEAVTSFIGGIGSNSETHSDNFHHNLNPMAYTGHGDPFDDLDLGSDKNGAAVSDAPLKVNENIFKKFFG